MAVETDYSRNPSTGRQDSDYTTNPRVSDGDSSDERDLVEEWQEWIKDAEEDMKQYLPQIKVNRKFAAGKQNLDVNHRDGRVIDVRYRNGVKLVTADILTQYLLTAVGRMAGNDYKSNFLAGPENENADQITKDVNACFGWAWDNEIQGDKRVLQLWRLLVVDGTAALRCRYDRNFGEVIGDVPYKDGQPLLDRAEANKYVAETAAQGGTADIKTLKEGKIVWEVFTADQLLPPPGFDEPDDFPRFALKQPMLVSELKARYGAKANEIESEDLESSGSLTAGLGFSDTEPKKLKKMAMVYSCYVAPCTKYPKGAIFVICQDKKLDEFKEWPYNDQVRGYTSGVHFFRWQVLPGRFMGKAFIENGIGPQMIRNKRFTQIDNIIDKNMPFLFIEEQSLARRKTGAPMEYVEVRPGAPLPQVNQGVAPGAWMLQDVKMHEEAVEKAMGVRGITTGQPPAGISAYSALALLTENDALKLDPIAQDFRMETVNVNWDTVLAMKQWPPQKELLIMGDEDQLQTFLWRSNLIPEKFLMRPPRGGALPRSQASELQKVTDIFTAAMQRQDPRFDMDWYVESLNQGKPQKVPESLSNEQEHKAELENIVIAHTSQAPPPAAYDDDLKHVQIHRAFQTQLQQIVDMHGDQDGSVVAQVQALEGHIQAHMQAAQSKQGGASGQPGQLSPPGALIGNPQQGNRPPAADPNSPQSPNLPNVPPIATPTGTSPQ